MAIRFRKSIRIMPGVRINLSKSGLSTSIGGAPFTINVSRKGVRQTTSLPGTGISFSSMHGSARDAQRPAEFEKRTDSGVGWLVKTVTAMALIIGGVALISDNGTTPSQEAATALPASAQNAPPGLPPISQSSAANDDVSALPKVTIRGNRVAVRETPSLKGKIMVRVEKGLKVEVVRGEGKWLLVRHPSFAWDGWIDRSSVTQ